MNLHGDKLVTERMEMDQKHILSLVFFGISSDPLNKTSIVDSTFSPQYKQL